MSGQDRGPGRAWQLRPAAPEDLGRVVALDRAHSGQSRRGFFEKRWRSMESDAEAFAPSVW